MNKTALRSQDHSYTRFYRLPAQLEALSGPVLDFLGLGDSPDRVLRLLVFACSNGAEPYTVASELLRAHPGLGFSIQATDLHPSLIAKAREGLYGDGELVRNEFLTEERIAATFDREGQGWRVKTGIRDKVEFSQADLLDGTSCARLPPADIVFAQNVFFHFDPPLARAAFMNAAACLKTRSAFFINGMDLDLKIHLTRELGLAPLEFKHREIYEQSRLHLASDWWNYHYGSEPYSFLRRDRLRRYSSIFLKS
ncbi:MAG: CheR family methyltransferase [Elusimicrobiota bacterium]